MTTCFSEEFQKRRRTRNDHKKIIKRLSLAFAEETSGIAHVLLLTDDTDISNSIWTKIEKPALTRKGGNCIRIITVDPDNFDTQSVLWDRHGNNDLKTISSDAENESPLIYSVIPHSKSCLNRCLRIPFFNIVSAPGSEGSGPALSSN